MNKEYVDREVVKQAIIADGYEHFSGCLSSGETRLLELMLDSVEEIPVADVVSRECLNQIKFERDLAIKQLNSYGISFIAQTAAQKWTEGNKMINFKKYAKEMRENAYIKDGVVYVSQELWHQIADIIDSFQDNAVYVVRCKDCRYYGNTKKHKRCGECTNYNRIAYPDEFCSYGEKRRDEH